MEDIIKYLISELKQEYIWRAEDAECGGCEMQEGWDMREDAIRGNIAMHLKIDKYGYTMNKYCGTEL